MLIDINPRNLLILQIQKDLVEFFNFRYPECFVFGRQEHYHYEYGYILWTFYLKDDKYNYIKIRLSTEGLEIKEPMYIAMVFIKRLLTKDLASKYANLLNLSIDYLRANPVFDDYRGFLMDRFRGISQDAVKVEMALLPESLKRVCENRIRRA